MEDWKFLTSHARATVFMAADPAIRLRDLAAHLDVTERTAFGIVVDLTDAGYVVREKAGRRNRYRIRSHLPLRDSLPRQRTVGDLIDLFTVPRTGRLPVPPVYGPTSS